MPATNVEVTTSIFKGSSQALSGAACILSGATKAGTASSGGCLLAGGTYSSNGYGK